MKQAEKPRLRACSVPGGSSRVGVIKSSSDGSPERENVLRGDATSLADAPIAGALS
jgi:hypothetical protein